MEATLSISLRRTINEQLVAELVQCRFSAPGEYTRARSAARVKAE